MNERKNQLRTTQQLVKTIEGLGFSEQRLNLDFDSRDKLAEFLKESEAHTPQLELVVNRSEYGYHVIINSIPYDQNYNRSTGSPIQEGEVIDQIKQYLEEIRNSES